MTRTPWGRRCVHAGLLAGIALAAISLLTPRTGAAAAPPPDMLGTYAGTYHDNVTMSDGVAQLDVTTQRRRRFTGTLTVSVALPVKGTVSASGNVNMVAKEGGDMINAHGQLSEDGKTIEGTFRARFSNGQRANGTFAVTRP